MSRGTLYRWLVFLVPLAVFFSDPAGVGDLAVWIAHGLAILREHAVLKHDIFSVLPTAPLVYPSWGISIVYAWIYRTGGLRAELIFHAEVMVALLAILFKQSIYKLRSPWNGYNLGLIAFSLLGSVILWNNRPNLVALLPLAISFAIVTRARLSNREIAALALLELFWVNIHGSFVLLPLMLGWRAVFSRDTRAAVAAAVCLATCLVNPFGVAIFPYVYETFVISRIRILEWKTPTISAYFPAGFCFYALVAALAWRVRRNLEWLRSPYFLLIGLGFVSIRFAALPTLLFLPFAYDHGLLRDSREPAAPEPALKKALNVSIVACWVWIVILLNPYLKPRFATFLPPSKRAVFDDSAPFGAAEKIRASAKRGPVLADWILNSFLMLEQPNPIFLDTRNIIYSDAQFNEVANALNARPGWQDFLDRFHVAFVVLQKPRSALAEALDHNPTWTLSFEDSNTLLFERK